MEMTSTQRRIQRWFQAKRRELLASADLAQDHPSLTGGHREYFLREFLREFLPARLSADRGIVYGFADNAGECDAVIWDKANFPRLVMLDHSSFFAESVVCVVELKSHYSASELESSIVRCERLRQLSLSATNTRRFQHELEHLWSQVLAARDGVQFTGMSFVEPRIAYVLVFLYGGGSVDLEAVIGDRLDRIHDEWPDAVAFIDRGRFVRRFEPDMSEFEQGEEPVIQISSPGDDVLMALADELLRLINRRSFGADGLHDLGAYKPWSMTWDESATTEIRWRATHSLPGYSPHFADGSGESGREGDSQ